MNPGTLANPIRRSLRDKTRMKLATLCYVQHAGQTLMLHRVKKADDVHEGKWNGLGGKFEPGETPEACVIREIKEESGLLIRNPELRGILTFPGFAKDEDWYVFVFTASDFTGELIESVEGKLEWIDDSRLTGLNLWEGDLHFLKWIEEDKFFSASFTYKDGRLVDWSVSHHR